MIPKKQHWLDRAIEVYNFHVAQSKAENKWTVGQTSLTLNRSIGSVSQDILLASFSITHEKQLRRFKSMSDALEFVRSKQREMNLREI